MKLLSLMMQFIIQIGAGFLICKSGVLKEGARETLTTLILDLVLPCNVVVAFANSQIQGRTMIGVMLGSVAYSLLMLCLNRVLYRRYSEEEQPSLKYSTMIPNCAFLGTPLCESMYGSTGLTLASVYQIPERIVVWVFAPMYFNRNNGQSLRSAAKRMCTNPCVIAVVVGLFLMFTGIKVPDMIFTPIQKLGSCSTPLSMLMIGMLLSEVRLRDAVNAKVLYYCALRLIAIPALVLALFMPFRSLIGSAGFEVVVLMAALPGGTVAVLLAARHKMAEHFASQCLILSTLLSCVTLPCWSHLLTLI